MDADDLKTLKEAFELTAKAAAALLGLIYVCGLVVSALFLFPYGVYGLDLIRVHYVLAGLWILLPLLLIFLIVAIAIASFDAVGSLIEGDKEMTAMTRALPSPRETKSSKPSGTGKGVSSRPGDVQTFYSRSGGPRKARIERLVRWANEYAKRSDSVEGKKWAPLIRQKLRKFWPYAYRVFLASACVLVCLYVAWFALGNLIRPLGAESIAQETATAAFWMILRWLGGLVGILLLLTSYLHDLFGKLIESISQRASGAVAFFGGFALLAGGLYLADFSQSVYSKLPMTLGGGRPVIARVLIKPEAEAILELLKNGQTNTLQSGATRIVQIDLLLETSRGYFVRVSEHPPKAALIPREVVQAVILEGNAPKRQ